MGSLSEMIICTATVFTIQETKLYSPSIACEITLSLRLCCVATALMLLCGRRNGTAVMRLDCAATPAGAREESIVCMFTRH